MDKYNFLGCLETLFSFNVLSILQRFINDLTSFHKTFYILVHVCRHRLLGFEKKKDAQVFLLLSTIGHFSLFPLIFTPAGKFPPTAQPVM